MAYGTISPNNYIFHGNSSSKNTSQLDLRYFTDMHQAYTTSGVHSEGANFILIGANGGGMTVQTASIHSEFGLTASSGIIGLSTGLTNNTTGNASVYAAQHIAGIPTPSTGLITKYECETLIEPRSSTGIPDATNNGFFRFGFMDSQNQLSPANGVYFEYFNDNSTKTDTTWYISFMNSSEERVNTGVTVTAGKIYRLYLCVERDTAGNFTTTYNVKNITDNTGAAGTAAPSTTARYPSSVSADFMYPAFVISKATTGTATTVTKTVLIDYIGVRIQMPLDREILLLS